VCDILFKVIPYGSLHYEAAVALRVDILRKPFGLSFHPQEREQEKDYIHIAGFKGEQVVATAALVLEGEVCKMQRVVVDMKMQNSGIGSKMMVFCEEYARAQGFKSIYCHARDTAVQFYLKNGYTSEGAYFDEDTLPHLKMGKVLLP